MYFKFYQYINGEWISHYKSEIEIQQYTNQLKFQFWEHVKAESYLV